MQHNAKSYNLICGSRANILTCIPYLSCFPTCAQSNLTFCFFYLFLLIIFNSASCSEEAHRLYLGWMGLEALDNIPKMTMIMLNAIIFLFFLKMLSFWWSVPFFEMGIQQAPNWIVLCIMHALWLSIPINGNESFLGLSAAILPLLVVAACFVIFYCSFPIYLILIKKSSFLGLLTY